MIRISIFAILIFVHPSFCQKKIEKELSYTSDFAFNLSGGNRTGAAWLGCFQATVLLNTEKLNLWKDGTIKFSYISTHGQSFSELTGDLQIASNIDAGHMATTFELWYQHRLEKLKMTFGILDLNALFSYSELALSLINSSFGIQPTISGNMPVPIYPITALGAAIEYQLNNKIGVKLSFLTERHR